MKSYWLPVLVSAAMCASAVPVPAAAGHDLRVRVHVKIVRIAPGAVTISCGAFPAGPPPTIGSRPLTHVFKTPASADGMVAMSVPIPSGAQLVACWPSTSARAGLDEKRTTRMVSARFPIPLPPDPITMAPITVVGNGR
jgi:hypothetical protein